LREIVTGALLNDGERIMSTLAERWIEEGKQKGLELGVQKGHQEGLQEGLQKGSAAATREAVAGVLEARFEVVSRSILRRLESIDDVSVLKTLLRKAATAATLDEFRREMEAIFP
jgi:flagellar biosynthesis/type III secretory pathway protein FliH